MTAFTPLSALFGGALIGLSAVLLLWLNGRVAGISGILYGVFSRDGSERNWRLTFVAGLILGGFLYQLVTRMPLATRTDFPLGLLALAGLLVGIGTRLGSGCTSGHAVCGISRLSLRSVLATVTFIATGILTTTLMRLFVGNVQ
jgi:uncharacterized membrane protein YedE/YeeE